MNEPDERPHGSGKLAVLDIKIIDRPALTRRIKKKKKHLLNTLDFIMLKDFLRRVPSPPDSAFLGDVNSLGDQR